MKILSIAIPCYNSAAYMRRCIDSLLSGGEDVEILIVDDGSTKDNTAEIADEYEKNYPGIVKAIHQENGGHGEAVNAGLRNANAKPGIIMEAFSVSGESNLVFIINELDKAASGKGNGNPADVLLTLLDNLGFTDNYMECMIPTTGVYPIATANNKEQISAPLMSRFAVIDIPDYTPDEKKIIFSKFALPKILKRMSLKENECKMTDEALDAVIELFSNTSGIRDLEQAAEHIAANALYQIEVNRVSEVVFTAEMVRSLLRD